MNLDDLEHSGVKGMKWGVRKPRDEKARAKQFGPKSKKEVKKSTDFKATEKYRGQDPRSLTNKQLKALNERMNLEKNYAQNYSKISPSKAKRGEERVKATLATLGLAVSMYNLVRSPFGQDTIWLGKQLTTVAAPAVKSLVPKKPTVVPPQLF